MIGVRIRARLRRKQLDDDLARGLDPDTSAERSLRASRLTSPDTRLRLAGVLVDALGSARMNHLGPFRRKHLQRDAAISESAEDVLALARRLQDGEPITARGAAMASRLLRDRSSPFHGTSAADLQVALRAAHEALDVPDEPAHELAGAA